MNAFSAYAMNCGGQSIEKSMICPFEANLIPTDQSKREGALGWSEQDPVQEHLGALDAFCNSATTHPKVYEQQ